MLKLEFVGTFFSFYFIIGGWFHLARVNGVSAMPAFSQPDCNMPPYLVSNINDLNIAIDCYNAKISGTHTISLTNGFVLTDTTIPIDKDKGRHRKLPTITTP